MNNVMKTTVTEPPLPIRQLVSAELMMIGQIGVIRDNVRPIMHAPYTGEIVMRVFDGLVSLNNPENTWRNLQNLGFLIEPFPLGTVVSLTVTKA